MVNKIKREGEGVHKVRYNLEVGGEERKQGNIRKRGGDKEANQVV